MSERCELSDLLVAECACRIHGPKDPMIVAGYAFEARFEGACRRCWESIDVGDDICLHDGAYVHAHCVPEVSAAGE